MWRTLLVPGGILMTIAAFFVPAATQYVLDLIKTKIEDFRIEARRRRAKRRTQQES